jgi:L-ornithine N5-monooxygenase
LGIGFGPSNIALAIAIEEEERPISRCFLEAMPDSKWQRNMLLDGSDIQNNPLRDLVTPRNPRSHYTFINYLKAQDRLFRFLALPMRYPLRKEYSAYVEWVASHFKSHVQYEAAVDEIFFDQRAQLWGARSAGHTYYGRSLIVGIGRSPCSCSSARIRHALKCTLDRFVSGAFSKWRTPAN